MNFRFNVSPVRREFAYVIVPRLKNAYRVRKFSFHRTIDCRNLAARVKPRALKVYLECATVGHNLSITDTHGKNDFAEIQI